MTTQHSLIGSMLNHETFQRLSGHISAEAFDNELKLIYQTLSKAHDDYQRDITLPELRVLHLATIPTATKARKENIETLLNRVNESKIYGPDVLADLLNAHYAETVGEQIAEIGMKISENSDDRAELIESAEKLISDLRTGYKKGMIDEPASWDFDDIQDSLRELEGFKVSIPPLAEVHPTIPRGYFAIFAARPETGKCLAKGQRVVMEDGSYKCVEDIVVGDKLAGTLGSYPRTVLSLGSGVDDLYRVTLRDGSSFVCNSVHMLCLERRKSEGKHKSGDRLVVPLDEYLKWPQGRKDRFYMYRKAFLGGSNDVLYMDPYLLGFWLGDGTSSKPEFTIGKEDAPYIVPRIQELLPEGCHMNSEGYYKGVTYRVTGEKNKNLFLNALREYNLLNNKHVPEYVFGTTVSYRERVLAGLLDADGYYARGFYEIIQLNKTLAEGIVRLAKSLGFFVTYKTVHKSAHKGHKGEYVRINISPGTIADVNCLIPRKMHKASLARKDRARQPFTVEYIGKGEYYGFTLDGNQEFLTEDYIVTHNTSFHASLSVGPGGFAYQGARVHVLLNEEKYTRVRNRYATVAVGVDSRSLLANREEASRILEPLRERVSIHDATGWTIGQVEDHVTKHNPDIVIIDMLDKVGMPGTFNGRHEMLSQLYYRARDLAKVTDTTLFGGSQVSADGEHKIRLDMSMLADSKTGKAAEADLVYMIGKGFSNEGVDPMRYINVAKDKAYGLTGTMVTAMLDVQTGRYMS